MASKKVSFNKLEKIIENNKTNNTDNKIEFAINDEVVEVEVKNLITIEEMSEFVNIVVNCIFDNDDYSPEFYNMTFVKVLLNYYTNIKIDSIKNSLLLSLMYETDVVEAIIEKINKKQYAHIVESVAHSIKFKQKQILSINNIKSNAIIDRIVNEQNELANSINSLIEQFAKISESFSEDQKERLITAAEQIASKSEKEIAETFLNQNN